MDVSPTSQTQHFQTQTASFTIVPISFNKKFHFFHFSDQILESNAWLPFSYISLSPSWLQHSLSWSLLPLLLPTFDSPRKSRGILWKCTDPVTSHGSHLTQSKGQWLLWFIKPYAIWPPPHSHFHLTVLSAHVSTVLIYFIYLGIQGTLQTCQIPVRGFLPQECFPLEYPPLRSLQGPSKPSLQAFQVGLPYHKVSPDCPASIHCVPHCLCPFL